MTSVYLTRAAYVDAEHILGTRFPLRTWSDVGFDPRHDKLRWRKLFESKFPGFRRIDRLSKVICIADEAAGIAERVQLAAESTALLFASVYGCLDADVRFEASLERPAGIEAGLFPYTLPSTPLCELAIRHGLNGPTLSLTVEPGEERTGIEAGVRYLASGEAESCVVCLGDWLPAESAEHVGVSPRTRLAVILLESREPDSEPLAKVDALMSAADPLLVLESVLMNRSA